RRATVRSAQAPPRGEPEQDLGGLRRRRGGLGGGDVRRALGGLPRAHHRRLPRARPRRRGARSPGGPVRVAAQARARGEGLGDAHSRPRGPARPGGCPAVQCPGGVSLRRRRSRTPGRFPSGRVVTRGSGGYLPSPGMHLQNLAAFVLLLGALVFVHELGHFLFAKAVGVKVLRFSIGFGPPLLSFTRGETEYRIAALPLGGYVKMAGEVPGEDAAPE